MASVPELTKRTFSHVGKGRDHNFGEIGFGGRGRAEAGAIAGGVDDGFEHSGDGVAENERSPGADVVDVFVAVGVPDVRAQPAHEEWRIAADGAKGAHRGVHAAGNHLLGALLQLARHLEFAGHGLSGESGTYGSSQWPDLAERSARRIIGAVFRASAEKG